MKSIVPFNRPLILETAYRYIRETAANMHLAGDGPFTKKCHALLENKLAGARALLTTSCTHALEMAAFLLDIVPGDEVIVPSFTFVSTANAFVLRGARPIFADVRPDTLNLDEKQLEALVSRNVRAIVAVHYAGVACEMEAITAVAERHGLAIVEDNAHGFLGHYHGRPLGTFGQMATLSFHETKNFTCGEGGALLINDPKFIERAEVLREKGTDRSRFFRGQVDKYTWVDVGSSYLLSDVLAALLLSQLEAADAIQARRQAIWERYASDLAEWAHDSGARLPVVPDGCEHPAHLFYLLMSSPDDREGLISHLRSQGIGALFHYVPLHLSPMGRRFGARLGDCPIAETTSACLVRLPLFNDMNDRHQDLVIAGIKSYRTSARRSATRVAEASRAA